MNAEDFKGLRECCQSDAAFERLQQILLKAEAERQQVELTTLSLLGDRVRHAIGATDRQKYLESLEQLIIERTAALQAANVRLHQEIADRRWAETALHESEQRFRSLIENATDIIVILDQGGVFRYCSPSAKRVLGYTLQDVVGHSATEFVHEDDVPLIMQVLAQSVANPGVSQPAIEYRVRHRNGSFCLFEAVATSLLADPAIRGVVINCHDITERQQAEEALRAANRQIVNILESITDAFMSLDTEWRFTYVNQRAAELCQRSQTDLLGQIFWEAFPEIIGSTFDREYHRAMAQQIPITFEEFHPLLNVWFEVRVFPAADGLSIFLLDVTERRQAQTELLEMSTALGNAVEGIARLDSQNRYVALNRAYAAGLGYPQEAMIGMSWWQTVHPDDRPRLATAYEQMQTNGKAEVEIRSVRQDGSTFHNELVIVAAYDWHDRFVGHHCFTKDITERKQAEEALRQQAERERLVSTIAQRIRNSLDLEAILNTTVSEVRQFLKADRVVICRIDAENNGLIIAESVEPNWSSHLQLWVTGDWFQQQYQVCQQGENLVINDFEQVEQTPAYHQIVTQMQVKASLKVPILHGQKLWGVLVVHQCSAARHWEAFEIGLLEQLATQVAIAIQQSELYQQVQQFNAELEAIVQERTVQLWQALHYEALLKRITDAVRDSLDESTILETAVQELAVGLNVSSCGTGLYDLEQHTSTIRYEYIAAAAPVLQGTVVPMSKHPEIYKHLLQGDCLQFCWHFAPEDAEAAGQLDDRYFSVLAYPISDEHGVIGDLWVYKPVQKCFEELDIRLVQQVTTQCAIAIRQARLYQAAQAQVAALEELNLLKDDFLSTVSHELRTPMSNMKMAIYMLRSVSTADKQERYLNILQSECVREIELINDLLDLQRLEASSYRVTLEPLDLRTYLMELVEPFLSRTLDRQQTLVLELPPELPQIETDRSSLERVLAELLNNACKYTAPGGEVVLQVEVTPAGAPNAAAQVIFTVGNQAEIPKSELSHVFDKFYRVPGNDRWKQGGTGLGLALVHRLVTQLNGTIQAESEQGWTTFTVHLPLYHP
jgi:PAS domain S-box-containing protein